MAARTGVLAMICVIGLVGTAAAKMSEHMTLRFVGSHKIADRPHAFTEVSGLSLARDGGFWSVSDNAARLFQLDEDGKIRHASSPDAEPGLEGVALDVAGGRILVVREDTREILAWAEDGTVTRHPILGMDGGNGLAAHFLDSDANDGLEGITVDATSGAVYVIKERAPRLLIEIAPDLAKVRRVISLTEAAGFASDAAGDDHLDVSGLAWDGPRQGLWMTSDTGKAIYFFDLATSQARGWALVTDEKGKQQRVSNAEGVALGDGGRVLFVVTDDGKDSRLIEYRIE
jgi:uncharacterized protein YjiK